jgi:hypothetical protein
MLKRYYHPSVKDLAQKLGWLGKTKLSASFDFLLDWKEAGQCLPLHRSLF